ncbi:site-2 protease family protein [Lacipirellula sp.]|uniref:site-2 protease family protein n=1 Tax=Lacipirellula sp. TaxID=2691419 RepID=UPI003D0E5682
MLLSEPPRSPYDLHFRLFGIPIRVHPMFWVITIVLGVGSDGVPPAQLLAWTVVVFVSVVVHELGHAFTQRYYGGRPWITLYGLGGLAACDDCDRRPLSQILISLAGPAAGFALAGVCFASVRLSGRQIGWAALDEIDITAMTLPLLGKLLYVEPLPSEFGNSFILQMLWVNIAWGLINLLPIYPLDGGRVAREIFTLRHPRRGIIWSLQLSMAAAISMGLFGLFEWRSLFTAIMFGYLAYSNYQTLQAYRENRW